jgi:hypothetical protein
MTRGPLVFPPHHLRGRPARIPIVCVGPDGPAAPLGRFVRRSDSGLRKTIRAILAGPRPVPVPGPSEPAAPIPGARCLRRRERRERERAGGGQA